MPKCELYIVRWILAAKPGPSQRGRKSRYPCVFLFFKNVFGRPIAVTCPDAPVASEPYTPRLKDCTGLGPNTLKKVVNTVLMPF